MPILERSTEETEVHQGKVTVGRAGSSEVMGCEHRPSGLSTDLPPSRKTRDHKPQR